MYLIPLQHGEYPILVAAREGNVMEVRRLVDSGADVNVLSPVSKLRQHHSDHCIFF